MTKHWTGSTYYDVQKFYFHFNHLVNSNLIWNWNEFYCIITARKRSLRRLCFYRYLSVHGGRAWFIVGAPWGVRVWLFHTHAWLLWGGMYGCSRGGHAWLLNQVHGCSQGGHGCSEGAFVVAWGACMVNMGGPFRCVIAPGGACVGHDEIRSMSGTVRILLECILTFIIFPIVTIWYLAERFWGFILISDFERPALYASVLSYIHTGTLRDWGRDRDRDRYYAEIIHAGCVCGQNWTSESHWLDCVYWTTFENLAEHVLFLGKFF